MANLIKVGPKGFLRKVQDYIEENGIETKQTELVEQSPVWLRASIWTLIATAGFGIGWLALAQTDEVVMASGKLEPIGDVKDVRVPMSGVVDKIFVKEGQLVRKGQTLLKLDTEATKEREQIFSKNVGLKKSQLNLKREELSRYLRLNDTEQEVLRGNLKLQKEVLKRFIYLKSEGAATGMQELQQREKIQQIEGEIAKRGDDRERQRAFLGQQIEQLKVELGNLRNQLTEAQVQLRYREIISPVDGVIFELQPSAPGYVAQPTVPVLKVVPSGSLEAQVTIPSKSIGFVRVGQKVDISIDSFPASDFGVLGGKVKQVGSDALPPDPSKGIMDYRFPADIQLMSQQLDLKSGQRLPLQAGMSLSANIKLRKVSYLQLLLGSFKDKTASLNEI